MRAACRVLNKPPGLLPFFVSRGLRRHSPAGGAGAPPPSRVSRAPVLDRAKGPEQSLHGGDEGGRRSRRVRTRCTPHARTCRSGRRESNPRSQFGSQGRRRPAPLRRADGSQDHQTAAGPRGSPRAPVRSGTNLARGRAAARPMSRRHDGTQRKRCDHWVMRRTETAVPRLSPGRAASAQPALLVAVLGVRPWPLWPCGHGHRRQPADGPLTHQSWLPRACAGHPGQSAQDRQGRPLPDDLRQALQAIHQHEIAHQFDPPNEHGISPRQGEPRQPARRCAPERWSGDGHE